MVKLILMAILIENPILTPLLFLVLLLLIEFGRRLRDRSTAAGRSIPGSAAMESAVFALFGLLLAFTFSGAMSRYDAHRELILQEVNDIGTAYLRLDLLPAAAQPALRQDFRAYTAVRARRFDDLDGSPPSQQAASETARLQADIWKRAVPAAALPEANKDATKLLLPSLNDMFDMTATRRNAFHMHPPTIVSILLFALACGCALVAGFGMTGTNRGWLHMVVFAATISLTIFTTIDIEYPRLGLVKLTSHDQLFLDLLNTMN